METAASALSILPSSKEQVQVFSDKLRDELDNGITYALDLVRAKKYLDKVFENIKPKLDQYARNEAEKYGEKKFQYKGLHIELAENGVEYDYEGTKDPVYLKYAREAEAANRKLKERQQLLRALKEPLTVVDTDTGDVIEVFPPVRKSTSGIKVSLV